jgi:hypothetical protein
MIKQPLTASLCCNATVSAKEDVLVLSQSKQASSDHERFWPEHDCGLRSRNAKACMMVAENSSAVNDWNCQKAGIAGKLTHIAQTVT